MEALNPKPDVVPEGKSPALMIDLTAVQAASAGKDKEPQKATTTFVVDDDEGPAAKAQTQAMPAPLGDLASAPAVLTAATENMERQTATANSSAAPIGVVENMASAPVVSIGVVENMASAPPVATDVPESTASHTANPPAVSTGVVENMASAPAASTDIPENMANNAAARAPDSSTAGAEDMATVSAEPTAATDSANVSAEPTAATTDPAAPARPGDVEATSGTSQRSEEAGRAGVSGVEPASTDPQGTEVPAG